MSKKRMRVFAGPNGSGKSTSLSGTLEKKGIKLGVYVNADDIEKELNSNQNKLNISQFKITPTQEDLANFFIESEFSPIKRNEPELWQKLQLLSGFLFANTFIDSYLAADIAEFIRQTLLNQGTSFTYETVMSDKRKVEFMEKARANGFKVYLYFVSTIDPVININRVSIRVNQSGHQVPEIKIRERYFKSLENLKSAVQQSNNAYIFDNSDNFPYLVATVLNGNEVYPEEVEVPLWVETYLLS